MASKLRKAKNKIQKNLDELMDDVCQRLEKLQQDFEEKIRTLKQMVKNAEAAVNQLK